MIKHYCDNCGKEMKEKDFKRLKIVKTINKELFIAIEVIIGTGRDGINITWNNGDICHACIKKLIKEEK